MVLVHGIKRRLKGILIPVYHAIGMKAVTRPAEMQSRQSSQASLLSSSPARGSSKGARFVLCRKTPVAR